MSLTNEDLNQIQKIISTELNGKLDKRFEKLDKHLDKSFIMISEEIKGLNKKIDANTKSINELSGQIGGN